MNENDDESLRARADKLADALKGAQGRQGRDVAPPSRKSTADAAGMALALRASSEIVAGVVVGGAFGWGLDWLFHTKPACLILFLLLGSAAGIANVIRSTAPKSRT